MLKFDTVENAALSLDAQLPGWEWDVDPDKIVMSNPRLCVVGQLFSPEFPEGAIGVFNHGLDQIGALDTDHTGRSAFFSDAPVGQWVTEIIKRRAFNDIYV